MEDWRRKRIEDVYSKWEKRGRGAPTPAECRSFASASAVGRRIPRYPNGSLGNRRGRQSIESAVAPLPAFVPSLGIDTNALLAANVNKYTSIARCCQQCVPSSRSKYYSEEIPGAGLQDMLVIDKRQNPGLFGRLFPFLTQALCAKVDYSMGDLRKDTLTSRRVTDAIEICAKANSEDDPTQYESALKEQQQRAKKIVYSMSTGVYSSLTRFVAWLLFWVFKRLFNQICVQKKHVHMLKQAQKCGVPIVFLPSHKSHMDYIIMTFVLFNLGIPVPRIAAGDNLQLPILSWLVRHLGGFFIKRRLDSSAGKDVLYRKCLHEYMERCLVGNDNMEFFIEGSRSRSGKTTSPKAGLLSVLMDTVQEGDVEDILVVPVNISYDKLLEKNFVRHELMGGSKKAETFRDSLRGAWSMLSTNIGSVRIDFAQPFSMQEYLISAHISNSSLLEMSNVSRSRSVVSLVDLAHRRLVTAASHHIVYDISQCASLMSTSMVAFLLLNKHREGVSVSELIESYRWLEKKATLKGRAVSYTGEPSEAVHYALHYLSGLVTMENGTGLQTSGKNGLIKNDLIVLPRLELPDVFELLHHSNQVSPLLVLEGVVAKSIVSAVWEELRGGANNSQLEVDREEVIEDALFLCKLFAREFIFAPPCVDMWSVLNDTLESYITSGFLKTQSGPSGGQRAHTLPELDDEDHDEYSTRVMLEVNRDADSMKQLSFLGRIFDPFIESYWMTCVTLGQVKEGENIIEGEFLKQLQDKMVEKTAKGVLGNVESCSMDSLRNSIKSLVDMELVAYSNGSPVFHVKNSSKLIDLAEFLTEFKS